MAKEKVTAANAITGYCMSTKEKGVELKNAVVNKNGKRYLAQGDDGKGHKMAVILGEAKALAAIEAGTATKGTGWGAGEKAAKKKK